jgi:hypothetical protein
MSNRLALLIVHLILLVLASTCFTIVTGLADGRFQWEYFQYFSQNGWGVPYQFRYSWPVVLTYLAAYAIGVAAYFLLYRRGSQVVGLAGLVLCGAGFASFAYESTHWFADHYGSWIVSAPIIVMALTAVAAIQQYRHRTVEPRRGSCGSEQPTIAIN